MKLDPSLALALAVHANRGIYALLLGSGISRSAGIPTGWEVVIDLIRRVAALENQDPGMEALKWYRSKYRKDPSYSELLQALAPTQSERTSLLKGFFEPTEKDRESGLKIPTNAHLSIARLVRRGYVRVIVTTNFDRLMERALEAEGISPAVVYTPDQIAGMMPLQHTECLIIKVHGDYLDIRIKNTIDELAKYDEETNSLLDRIFSEYGLIVCGWSGDWDVALSDAIMRNTRHRFSTFWMTHSELSQRAVDLVKHRDAITIQISSADSAFVEMEDRIDALDKQKISDPRSPRIALATMKKYLAEEKYHIMLHDFVVKEMEEAKKKVALDAMPLSSPKPDKISYSARVYQVETACASLVPMVAAGVYWGEDKLISLWKRCVERLAATELRSGQSYKCWSELRFYPATLVVYAGCISAMIRNRFQFFKALLVDTRVSGFADKPLPVVAVIGSSFCLSGDLAQSLHGEKSNFKTPGSDWIVARIQPMISDVIGQDVAFEDLFDSVEFTISLIAVDTGYYPIWGRFGWRKGGIRGPSLSNQLILQLMKEGESHPLLAAGLFGRDVERAKKAAERIARLEEDLSF